MPDPNTIEVGMLSLKYPPRSLGEFRDDLRRIALGTAYALLPRRIAELPQVIAAMVLTAIGVQRRDACLDAPLPLTPGRGGLVGICGPMTPERLMAGFRRGLYPFSHVGRKKWWASENRMVVAPHRVTRDKDVRRMLRNKKFRVTFDTAFEEVIRGCAEPRPGRPPLTWITEDIIQAYCALHRAGPMHSFEVWDDTGNLAGGGFGVAVGPVFTIESQFTAQRNASKIGMVTLMRHLSAWGFQLADGKDHTAYLESVGFAEIPNADFLDVLSGPARITAPTGYWQVDDTLDASTDWMPALTPTPLPTTPVRQRDTHAA